MPYTILRIHNRWNFDIVCNCVVGIASRLECVVKYIVGIVCLARSSSDAPNLASPLDQDEISRFETLLLRHIDINESSCCSADKRMPLSRKLYGPVMFLSGIEQE